MTTPRGLRGRGALLTLALEAFRSSVRLPRGCSLSRPLACLAILLLALALGCGGPAAGETIVFAGSTVGAEGEEVVPNGIDSIFFTPGDRGLLFTTMLFDDAVGLGYLPLDGSGAIRPVAVAGTAHSGRGELIALTWLRADRYLVQYNIDGVSWAYEGAFDEDALVMRLDTVVCGEAPTPAVVSALAVIGAAGGAFWMFGRRRKPSELRAKLLTRQRDP